MRFARKASRTTLVIERTSGGTRRWWLLGVAALFGLLAAVWVAHTRSASPGAVLPAPSRLPVTEEDPPAPLPAAAWAMPIVEENQAVQLATYVAAEPAVPEKPAKPEPAASAPPKPLKLPSLKIARPVSPAAGDPPPPPGDPLKIPLVGTPPAGRVQLSESDGRISLVARSEPLNQLLMLLAQHQKLNIVCAENLSTPISVTLDQVPLEAALNSILSIAGCSWVHENGIIYVTTVSTTSKASAAVQGRQVRVFRLDFASAADVEKAVKGMLSPVGQCFTSVSKINDNRQAHEVVVVEDLPSYLQVVEQYIGQIDQPPRQVMIEARVLSVKLGSEDRCGVDLTALFNILHHDMKFQVHGLANGTAPQAFFFSFDGSDLDALVEALRTQTGAKTLAAPKVLVLNGQQAKIQVGRQIPFRIVTTTETSSMESVNFLDVGVILSVTPRISRDGQVLMKVKPEVSQDQQATGGDLPPTVDTTHVETDVLLADGRGMVIGGLIEEKDRETQAKVPFLGDLWLVGTLFRRKEVVRERNEYIITLVPRIAPTCLACDDGHAREMLRAETPVLDRNLQRVPRPWEGTLPDAIEQPTRLRDLPAKKHHACRQGEGTGCPTCPAGVSVQDEPYYATAVPGEAVAPPSPFLEDPPQPPALQNPPRP